MEELANAFSCLKAFPHSNRKDLLKACFREYIASTLGKVSLALEYMVQSDHGQKGKSQANSDTVVEG
jgi:hypothetical protein